MAGAEARKAILGIAKREYDESGVHSRLEAIAKRRKGKISPIRDEDHGLYGERVSWETKWKIAPLYGEFPLFEWVPWHRKHSVAITADGNDWSQRLSVKGKDEVRVSRFAEGSGRQEMTMALMRAERRSQSENARSLPEQKKRHYKHIFWGAQMPIASLGLFSAAAAGLSMLRLGLYGEPWIFPHMPIGILEPIVESTAGVSSYFTLRRIDTHLKNYNKRIEKKMVAY